MGSPRHRDLGRKTVAIEGQIADIASISARLQHTEHASVGEGIIVWSACSCRTSRADRCCHVAGHGRDVAGSAIAAAHTGNGVGERHCAALVGLQ